MITDIEDYFSRGCGRCGRFDTPDCSARQWARGLATLREICLSEGLSETVKWGHPCYMHAGRNIALIGALRGDFRLSFFNAALLAGGGGLLERQGPNTQHPDMISFTSDGKPVEMEEAIRSLLREAMEHAAAGRLPLKEERGLELPPELVDALDCDPELAEAFHRLTPGRQRSYVINLASTKNPDTRNARISRFRAKIIEGKGAAER